MASLKKGLSNIGSGVWSILEVLSEGMAEANAREVRRRTVTVWSEDRDAYVEVLLDAPPIWDGDKVRFARVDAVESPAPRVVRCNINSHISDCWDKNCFEHRGQWKPNLHPGEEPPES